MKLKFALAVPTRVAGVAAASYYYPGDAVTS
jgi:hypothetical protein